MTENITRRSILSLPLVALPIGISFTLSTGCSKLTQTQSNDLNVLLNTIVAGIQIALPFAEIFTPPPIGTYISLAAQFLNDLNTFVTTIITESTSPDPTTTKAQVVLNAVGAVILSPDVLAQLPTSFKDATGATVNVAAEIQALINATNSVIKLFAGMVSGASVLITPNNTILQLSVPSIPAAAKVIKTINLSALSSVMAPTTTTAKSNAMRLSAAVMVKNKK